MNESGQPYVRVSRCAKIIFLLILKIFKFFKFIPVTWYIERSTCVTIGLAINTISSQIIDANAKVLFRITKYMFKYQLDIEKKFTTK